MGEVGGGEGGGGGVCGVRVGGVKRGRLIRHCCLQPAEEHRCASDVWRTSLVGLESTMRGNPSPGRVVSLTMCRSHRSCSPLRLAAKSMLDGYPSGPAALDDKRIFN